MAYGARRRASRAPTARSSNYLQTQSLPHIHKMHHTVLSVLRLKGTMSEMELHLIRARLRSGLLQKTRRGELGGRLPTGLVYGPRCQVELDPDGQVQESFRHLFATFRRTESALAVVKAFRQEGLKFPNRV